MKLEEIKKVLKMDFIEDLNQKMLLRQKLREKREEGRFYFKSSGIDKYE